MSGTKVGMNENCTFPTCERLILSVGLEEAGCEQGSRGAQAVHWRVLECG